MRNGNAHPREAHPSRCLTPHWPVLWTQNPVCFHSPSVNTCPPASAAHPNRASEILPSGSSCLHRAPEAGDENTHRVFILPESAC